MSVQRGRLEAGGPAAWKAAFRNYLTLAFAIRDSRIANGSWGPGLETQLNDRVRIAGKASVSTPIDSKG